MKQVDTGLTKPGSTLLITETTGQNAAMYVLGEDGKFAPTELSDKAQQAVAALAETCQRSLVSAVYVGGAGGSAQAGVARYPLRLTHAVHAAKAVLTCGGAKVFVLPGEASPSTWTWKRCAPGPSPGCPPRPRWPPSNTPCALATTKRWAAIWKR